MYMRMNHPHLDDDIEIDPQDEYQVPDELMQLLKAPELRREEVVGEEGEAQVEANQPSEGECMCEGMC